MCHAVLHNATFYSLLLKIDEDLAAKTRKSRCPCGGCLHSARYPRKPRGGPANLDPAYGHRASFCCEREGCRRRTTPPSVRFLGRKVYLGVVVVLISALRAGASPPAARKLHALFGIDRRTLGRWTVWWRESFPKSAFWKKARGLLRGSWHRKRLLRLPLPLVEHFHANASEEGLLSLLRFLSPLTSESAARRDAF